MTSVERPVVTICFVEVVYSILVGHNWMFHCRYLGNDVRRFELRADHPLGVIGKQWPVVLAQYYSS